MSALTGVIHVGTEPAIGGGLRPELAVHCYEGPLARLVVHRVEEDGSLRRLEGAYVPDLDADPSYPVTDLLLAVRREGSAAVQRLDTLDRKAEANYGVTFREKVLGNDIARGTPGYGRLFEARSQLEAHPYEGIVAVAFYPGAGDRLRGAVTANLERLDAPTRLLVGAGP
jgi:hypothetical protein